MILTDREIRSFLANGQIRIEPEPLPERYSSTTVDLTLGSHIEVWNFPADKTVNPGRPGYKYENLRKAYASPMDIPGGFVLEPKQFILAWTSEVIELPYQTRIAARVEGKSSLARLAVGIHVTAPTIQSGFVGPLQLEVCNHGTARVELVPGMPICQGIFEMTLGTPEKGYSGQLKYQKPY